MSFGTFAHGGRSTVMVWPEIEGEAPTAPEVVPLPDVQATATIAVAASSDVMRAIVCRVIVFLLRW
jgi:hypothetical protein